MMADPGQVLDIQRLGVSVEFRRTTGQTDGELLEFDVVGRPRGFLTLPHLHPHQSERHEVIAGAMRITAHGSWRVLHPGDVWETPRNTPHRHVADGDEPGRVRVQIRPALRTEAWLERLHAMDRDGDFLPGGWPRPTAAARLLLDFDGEAHGV